MTEALELSSTVKLRCHRLPLTLTLSPVYRGEGRRRGWRDAAGVLAIVQLLDHEGFKYAALERCEPCSADKQIANRSW